jgi:phosphoesterase RecJ-like protein
VAPSPAPIQQILTIIEQHRSFVVTGHERPDGDAVGSSLALWHALRHLGKQVECVFRSGSPRVYSFLPGADAVQTELSMPQPQVVIVVDCDGRHRVDVAAEMMEQAQRVIDIDHHGSNPPFGDVAHIDTDACAAGELIYRLLNAGDLAIDAAIATCLYCAIATDTGFFRFQNTTPTALAVCSELIRAGANPHIIARRAVEEQSMSSTLLLGRALAGAESIAGGAIVTARLMPEDFAAAGADSEDVEGIVERLKFVEGARAAALLRDEGRGEIRVSLRAAAGVDVSRIAQKFGGGGHAAAAGCTMRGTMEDAHEAVASELRAAVV